MPSQDTRRTFITAIVVALVLLGMAAALFLIAPKEPPKSDVIAATQPNEIPATREVVPPAAALEEKLVERAIQALVKADKPRQVLATVPAISYDAKDGGRDNVDHIGYWDPLTWVRYSGVDFGKGISSVTAVVSCSSEFQGRVLYFHIDSHDGPVFAELPIGTTNGFEAISAPAKEVTGVHDVFITCNDGGFNFKSFKLIRNLLAVEGFPAGGYSASNGIREPTPGTIGHTDDGDWVKYGQVDFATGVASVAVDLAMGQRDATLRFHLDAVDGPIIGEMTVTPTGDWQTYAIQEAPVQGAKGVHDLYITFHGNAPGLPDIRRIQFKSP